MAVQINTALLFTHQVEAYILQIIAQNTPLSFFFNPIPYFSECTLKQSNYLGGGKGSRCGNGLPFLK